MAPSGVADMVVLDLSKQAMEIVAKRQTEGERNGFVVQIGDIGEGVILDNPHQPFDLVIDKGTIDCILSGVGGWDRGVTAIQSIYENMKTPSKLIVVSHSPPEDRLDLINSVYWHEVKDRLDLINSVYWHEVKVRGVRGTRLEDINKELYAETLVDLAMDGNEPKIEYNLDRMFDEKARYGKAPKPLKGMGDDEALALRPGQFPKPPPLPYSVFQAGQASKGESLKIT
eukprot:gene19131-25738_t